jgi:hypothetical protein
MLSSLISKSVGSSKAASSSKSVAKRSHKKRRQMLLQLDESDPSDVGGFQKKLPAAIKEKESASVLVVKAVQEKTSVLVAQGTQETGADAVEKKKRRRRRRDATLRVQELKTQAVVKKKRPDIEAM